MRARFCCIHAWRAVKLAYNSSVRASAHRSPTSRKVCSEFHLVCFWPVMNAGLHDRVYRPDESIMEIMCVALQLQHRVFPLSGNNSSSAGAVCNQVTPALAITCCPLKSTSESSSLRPFLSIYIVSASVEEKLIRIMSCFSFYNWDACA